MHFIPTGGITQTNIVDYLRLPSVLAVGGSWMVAPELVEKRAFDEVSRLSAAATQSVLSIRAAVGVDR